MFALIAGSLIAVIGAIDAQLPLHGGALQSLRRPEPEWESKPLDDLPILGWHDCPGWKFRRESELRSALESWLVSTQVPHQCFQSGLLCFPPLDARGRFHTGRKIIRPGKLLFGRQLRSSLKPRLEEEWSVGMLMEDDGNLESGCQTPTTDINRNLDAGATWTEEHPLNPLKDVGN